LIGFQKLLSTIDLDGIVFIEMHVLIDTNVLDNLPNLVEVVKQLLSQWWLLLRRLLLLANLV